MNYFRCTVGGSGKGNTVTVTCAEEFAGLTITLFKTGKTYTKTCPSTAPYVVTFNGVIKRFQYPGAFEQGFLSLNQ